ncbi:MAG: L,D-transpeptidase family protein [Sphingomonadales bacterium]
MKVFAAGLAFAAAMGQIPLAAPAAAAPQDALTEFQSQVRSDSPRQFRTFYAARGYQPVWFVDGSPSPAAQQLIRLLSGANVDGLDPGAYHVDRLAQALDEARDGDPRTLARAEILLSRALVAYARDLRRTNDSSMTFVDKELAPAAPAPATVLAAVAADAPLEQAAQMHPLYSQLRTAYVQWLDRWGRLPEVPIPSGPTLSSRSGGERVRLLRKRLGLADGTTFDKSVAATVREFRVAHGLSDQAIVDAPTLAVLNMPLRAEETRIRVNLQRARLLPPPSRGKHIIVDAAAQRLWLYDGNDLQGSMKVIVGKPSEPTPMMAALIRYAALNPYWWVPPDLVAKSIAPNVVSDGLGYLKAKGYQVLSDWSEDPTPLDPATIDWKAVAAGKVQLPMRQLPGPANMMGTIKFMFPNKFGVYLHDTPNKELFGDDDRRKSSGCIRLEDASRLAKWLFGTVPTASSSAAEERVPLPLPVPVYITYLTVAPTGSGLAIRNDVYGRDRQPGLRLAAAD